MPTPPRAVILDMGNVLIFHDNAKLSRVLAERSGRRPEQIEPLFHASAPLGAAINRGELDEEGMYRAICDTLGLKISYPELEALWSCHFDVHEEVLPFVEALCGRVRLVLLSNTNALHVRYCRSVLPILTRFDALLFSNEVGLMKPERAFYEQAVAAARVPAEACVFFDDIEAYVVAAREAGLRGHVFTKAAAFRAQLQELGLI